MSPGPMLQVTTSDPLPVYEQLRRQLADLIWLGALSPGERLPPLRQLAADLGVAVGTVARTYRQLEAEGLVASRRGGGTRVRAGAASSQVARRRELEAATEAYVRRARLLAASDTDVRAAIEAALGGDSSECVTPAG